MTKSTGQNWFYVIGTTKKGPLSIEQIKKLVGSGKIRSDTLVWREGLSEWTCLSNTELADVAPPPLPKPPAAWSRGRIKVLVVIAACIVPSLLITATTINQENRLLEELGLKPTAAVDSSDLIRFGLEIALFVFLWLRHRWARWLLFVLATLAAVVAFLTVLAFAHGEGQYVSIVVFLIYAWTSYMLFCDDDLSTYFS